MQEYLRSPRVSRTAENDAELEETVSMPIGVASFRVVKRVKDCDSDSLVAQWYCSASHMMYFVMHSLGTRTSVQRYVVTRDASIIRSYWQYTRLRPEIQ